MTRPATLLLRFLMIAVVGVVSIALVGSLLVPRVLDLRHAASFQPAAKIALPELLEGSRILDMHGNRMGQLVGAENRQVIPLDQVSDTMIATVLAVEDADFYEHNGVSAKSVLRALRANSAAGTISQGGSTITQQLVKLSIVGNDQTLSRKVKEASLAVQLENQFCEGRPKRECKNRILEQYLNLVYLGRGAYGVQAAARTYYGIDAAEIGWSEAVILTALIRNPNGYDPIQYPERAEARREIVLNRLLEVGLISQAEADLIAIAPLPTQVRSPSSTASAEDLSYFERKVRDELLDAEWLAPSEELRRYLIFNGGLTITSTYDPRAQMLAEAASASNPIAERNPESVAVVAAVEPSTGAVRAVVGETTVPGRGVVEVANPMLGRSPGSSFKTFTLVAALEAGHSVRDTISASPAPRRLYEDWQITTDTWPSGCRGGSVDLVRATASSNNCAFARLQAAVGGDKVIDAARRLGITTLGPDDNVPSLSLGGTSVRPLEMAVAYATIANDGRYNAPHFITKVEDRDGNVLFEHEPSDEQAIPVDVARNATLAMRAVVTGGTYGAGALPGGRAAAGKTGTNETASGGNTDVWFVGYTPQIATAVWIGNPAGTTELRGGRVQGGTTAARVWRKFMAPYHEGMPMTDFVEPVPNWNRQYIQDPWRQEYRSSRSSRSSGSSARRSTRPRAEQRPAQTAPPAQEVPAPPPEAPPPPPPPPAPSPEGGSPSDNARAAVREAAAPT
jgi:penicillin-binding protein 1A